MRMHRDTKFLVGAACVYKYIYIYREREREKKPENCGTRGNPNETGIPPHFHATQCCPKLAELPMRRKDRRFVREAR